MLGAGKLAMLLGGAGQGQPAALPWATAFLGPGPWASLAPALPSHPSQAYEGFATLALALVLGLVLARPLRARRATAGLLLGALALWALVRAAVTLTWRDPAVVWELNAGTLIALGVAIGFAVAFVAVVARGQGDAGAADASDDPPPVVAGPGGPTAATSRRPRGRGAGRPAGRMAVDGVS